MSIKVYIFGEEILCRINLWCQILLLCLLRNHKNSVFLCPKLSLIIICLKMLLEGRNCPNLVDICMLRHSSKISPNILTISILANVRPWILQKISSPKMYTFIDITPTLKSYGTEENLKKSGKFLLWGTWNVID